MRERDAIAWLFSVTTGVAVVAVVVFVIMGGVGDVAKASLCIAGMALIAAAAALL